jgi:mono/diheme cytochrome c family protein
MKSFSPIGVVTFAIAAFGAATSAIAQAPDAAHGDVGNGKRLYLADGCFTCHGRAGQGGAYTGPAPALARSGLPFDGFKAQIRDPSDNMPAYSDAVLFGQGHRRHLCVRGIAAGRAFGEGHFDPRQLRS